MGRTKNLKIIISNIIQFNISVTICTLPTNISTNKDFYFKLIPFRSWLMAIPTAEILLLGNQAIYDPENVLIKTLISEFPNAWLKTYPVDLGFDYRPYIKSWFLNGNKYSTSDIVIMMNNDIIIKRSFGKRLKIIMDNYDKIEGKRANPLFVGDRFDSFLLKYIDHHLQYEEFKNYIHPKSYMIYGCDYFIFYTKFPPFDLSKFPSYVAGIYKWNNHFLCLSHRSTKVISLNPYIDVFHVEHYR